MKLKICGMKYQDNIQEVASLHPEYMGFIFYEKSPRYFSGIMPEISKSVLKVGVFVNASLNEIMDKIKQYNLQIIQLHGNETPEFCTLLKPMNVEIIKVFSVGNNFNFEVVQPYESVCNYFLFDTKGEKPGGNGTAFNWQILHHYPSKKPFFLSGGIGLEEMKNIKKLNIPIHAIDVNSKFEIAPGLKNATHLKVLQHELSR